MAWFWLNVLWLTVRVASPMGKPMLLMAPPAPLTPFTPGSPAPPMARLPVNVLWLTVNVGPPSLAMPPPREALTPLGGTGVLRGPPWARLWLKVVRTTDRLRPWLKMPPPRPVASAPPTAWLPVKVPSRTVKVAPALLKMPPPRATSPGPPRAWLSAKTERLTVRVPRLRTPAPSTARPWATVSRLRDTVVPLLMCKTRSASLPLMVSRLTPGPLISRSSVMSSWPEARAMVPANPGAKAMSSAPGRALASRIACRSEPAPLSPRFRTVKVLSTVLSSRASSRGTKRCLWCRPRRRPRWRGVPGESDFRDRSKEIGHMVQPSLSEAVCLIMDAATDPGAQTGRRGGARPAGGLLGGKDPTGRFHQPPHGQSSFRIVPRPRFLVNSELLLLPNRSR